jgi:hypothetical protein
VNADPDLFNKWIEAPGRSSGSSSLESFFERRPHKKN